MKRLAIVVAAMLLAACSTPKHDVEQDTPPVPAGWLTRDGPTAPVPEDWWVRFHDPVLTRLVELALANNRDVATAVARVREARGQEAVARAQELPSVNFALNDTRSRNFNAFGQLATTTTRENLFQASYELDLFGRTAELVDAARASTEASEAARDAAALSVAAATATGYITLRALDARLLILERTVESRSEAMRVARRRAEVGFTSDLEMHQAEADYEGTAQQVPQTQLAIEREEHALALLTGSPPAAIARGLALVEIASPPVPDTLPSGLLRGRPDIAQAERSLVAADASLASARTQFLPTVQLSASLGTLAITQLPQGMIWSLGLSVLQPIFDGGRIKGQIETTAGRRDEAAYAYQRTVLTAFREVEDNLSAVVRTREQRARLEAQQAALANALFHASRRYQAGYASYLDQLDAQRGELTAELSVVQARADELNALVALAQAVGGGWTGLPETTQAPSASRQ
jgi:NodT family efflux transporter outer membrane factor (OMF) lipoprotein